MNYKNLLGILISPPNLIRHLLYSKNKAISYQTRLSSKQYKKTSKYRPKTHNTGNYQNRKRRVIMQPRPGF